MRESVFETLVGFGVVMVAFIFLWFGFARGGDGTGGGETELIGVRFNSAASIQRGTDVRMAGVKIGTVRDISLDRMRSEAQILMAVREDILPFGDGTTARVQSEGLLGGSYINLEEADGFGEIVACEGDEVIFGDTGCGEILYGQGSIDLMTLFASFASGSSGGDNTSSSSTESSFEEYPYPAAPTVTDESDLEEVD